MNAHAGSHTHAHEHRDSGRCPASHEVVSLTPPAGSGFYFVGQSVGGRKWGVEEGGSKGRRQLDWMQSRLTD